MTYEHLKISRDGHIATVTFDRPERANATNYALLVEMEHAALSFRDDLESRVVIFTGHGKHFCSGFDLSDPDAGYEGSMLHRRRATRIGGRVIKAMTEMDQITIAAWNGAAVGGGACITTALDFRICSQTAKMCYPEIDLGFNLMWFGLPLAVHLLGPAKAKRLVIGGEWIGADTLDEWGLADLLVDDDDALPAAKQWAERYANKPPAAAQMIKQSINKISSALDYSIMHMDVDQNLLARSTDDSAEAIRAYLAKEAPKYTGN